MGERAMRVSLWLVGILLAVLALSSGAGAEPADAQQLSRHFTTGEILVKFDPTTPGYKKNEIHQRSGGRMEDEIPKIDVQVVGVPAGREKDRIAAYKRDPNVLFAEVNGFYRALGHATNDPQVGEQWQYNNTAQTGGTRDADIDAFEAWHVTAGSTQVEIAILDTGIDQSHEDLMGKVDQNVNFTDSPTVDDRQGHGTHVAGSAGGITDNSKGVAGTCPGCGLYNVKVLGDDGIGSFSGVAEGIRWATDNGAEVISMSLGGPAESETVEEAVEYAWDNGAVLTAAAGNDGVNIPSFPAFYDEVIAVAATDHNDTRAAFSNFGRWVDVAAPGVSILSTAPDHENLIFGGGVGYGTISGTSMATPHAAGVAGLVFSSGLCNDDSAVVDTDCVRDRIEDGADPVPATGSVHGRINAYNSLAAP